VSLEIAVVNQPGADARMCWPSHIWLPISGEYWL